mgnify:CR=1 FL=1|tara:strand:- start:2606 stop:3499 length:894 start_codon:yes stop_codon:yes gene_type:complete
MINNPIPWPNGARVAVAITLDMDADSLIHLSHPKDSHRRIAACSNLQYGPNVAIERILNTYRKFGLKQSFFIPGWSIENYPKVVEAIVKDGHEVGFHGYIHEHPNELSRDQEAEFMDRSIEIIKRFTGQSPKGNRAPLYNFSDNSLDLLLERGFEYDASLMGDDVPYLISNDRGSLVEIPSSWAVDDWPPYVHEPAMSFEMQVQSPEEAMRTFRAEFDAMWEHRGLWVAPWHPFVSGRLSRWMEVEKLIEYMIDKGGVWFARMDEIAAHVRNVTEEGHVPRDVRLPLYDGPVPEFQS